MSDWDCGCGYAACSSSEDFMLEGRWAVHSYLYIMQSIKGRLLFAKIIHSKHFLGCRYDG